MSRTNKDKPIEFGGKYNQTHINKNIKKYKKRNKLKQIFERPPLGFINKFLTDRWDWD